MARRITAGAGWLVLALGVTACGAGVQPRPTEDAAPVTTAAVDEASSAPTTAVPGSDAASAVEVLDTSLERTGAVESGRFEWVVMYEGGSADFPTQQVRATGEFADLGQSMHLTMTTTPDTGQFEETIVDGTIYLEMPGIGCQSADASEMLDGAAGSGGAVMDPSAMIDLLGGVGDGVTDEGHLDVRGVPTTHLSGTYTVRDAIDAARGDGAEALDQLFAGMPDSFLDAEQHADVFVDDSGLLRRMQVASPATEVQAMTIPAYTTIMDFFDFGADVAIEAPSPCQSGFTSNPQGSADFEPVGTPIDPGVGDPAVGAPAAAIDPNDPNIDAACDALLAGLSDLPADQRDEILAGLQDVLASCPG